MTDENRQTNARAELEKASTSLKAAKALADLGFYDDAASRLYYATFHLVSAALLLLGVQANTYGGVASLLGQYLVRPGLVPNSVAREFSALLGLRSQADYNRHFVLDGEGFAQELKRAEAVFTAVLPFLEREGLKLPG